MIKNTLYPDNILNAAPVFCLLSNHKKSPIIDFESIPNIKNLDKIAKELVLSKEKVGAYE